MKQRRKLVRGVKCIYKKVIKGREDLRDEYTVDYVEK